MRSRPQPLALVLLLAACSSAEDRAAKKRIFSPEEPPRVLRAAAEKLEAGSLGLDPALARRVLAITGQEAAHRLGPHVQKASVSMRWSGEGGEVDLAEERLVELGAMGDFHVRIENDERQGMEWYRRAGVSYARARYAPLRERRRDRGSSEHVLESGYATLATFADVLHGAIRFTPVGDVTVAGRPALSYTASLGQALPDAGPAELPPEEFSKGGPDADTRLRLEAARKGVPTAVSGTLVVDKETAVPLEAKLRGQMAVDGESGRSTLDLVVELSVSGVGKPLAIEIPTALADEPRRPGVVATLKAYDIPRATEEGEGGKGARTGEEEPDPEAEP